MSENAKQISPHPDWFEPFNVSLGFVERNRIYLSGQAAIDPDTGDVVGKEDFKTQTHQVFQNLKAVLNEAQSGLDKIVKATTYLTNIDHYGTFEEIWENTFEEPYPANTVVEVNSLALPELLIEIDVICLKEGKRRK